ncbi:hypothetical protein CFC21_009096, partial [Triticum aestivum]
MSSGSSSRSTSPSSDSGWSKKENKMFEEALAYYGVSAPNLWEKVASAMGAPSPPRRCAATSRSLSMTSTASSMAASHSPSTRPRASGP